MSESIGDVLAREAAEAEARAEAEERGEIAPTRGQRGRRRAADPSQVYAVRIPTSRLNELREVAARLDVPPTTLIRRLVLERLDELKTADQGTDDPERSNETPAAAEVKLGPRRQRGVMDDDTGKLRLYA
jgi:hypothetical protein